MSRCVYLYYKAFNGAFCLDQRINLCKNLPHDDESIRGQLIGKIKTK